MTLPFDPRTIPVEPLPVLPAVPHERLHVQALRERFAQPPAWQVEQAFDRQDRSDESVPAAVLVLLVARTHAASLSVLLTQRTAHLRTHGGQISFPGGRTEACDADPVATALRETHEEVGLSHERVEILGTLPVFVTGTGFAVTPVVGLINAHAEEPDALRLRLDPAEVDDVFEVPLPFLMNPQHHRKHVVRLGEQSFSYFSMPWQSQATAKEYFIWGATAAMLRNLYRMLSA
jgi:8-oxo-dGTP pyrophosphatase MutT (NUDIX family)